MSDTLRLILMRHGHSPMNAASDHLRVLSEHGQTQIRYMGQRLSEWPKRWVPQELWVSTAQRTQQTAQLLIQSWPALGQSKTHMLDDLYLADPNRWRETLSSSNASTILCIGHNPGLSDLIGELSGSWVNLEVGAAVGLYLQGQTGWNEALSVQWELRGRIQPSENL